MVKDAGHKQMKTGPHPDQRAFTALTRKQIAVLDLLANNRTSKEIGHALGIAEATVNRRIEVLRSRLGGVTRHELARRYRDWTSLADTSEPAADPCVETPPQFLPLAEPGLVRHVSGQDETATDRFEDALSLSLEAPWSREARQRIVPGVLDGKHAVLARIATIIAMLLGVVASLVLGLAAASAITDLLG